MFHYFLHYYYWQIVHLKHRLSQLFIALYAFMWTYFHEFANNTCRIFQTKRLFSSLFVFNFFVGIYLIQFHSLQIDLNCTPAETVTNAHKQTSRDISSLKIHVA